MWWLPIIGPVIQGIVQIFTKHTETALGKYQVDGQVVSTALNKSADITIAYKDDLGVKLCRDLIMFPGSLWCGLYLYDKIVALQYPEWVWGVAKLDGPLETLPFALLTFYFGLSAMNIWKR